jgi:hypothetical protein
LDKVPFGAAFGKGITMKMGQTNMHNYMKPLLERIEKRQIDPSYIISHRITLDEAPEMYKIWRDKKENVTKYGSIHGRTKKPPSDRKLCGELVALEPHNHTIRGMVRRRPPHAMPDPLSKVERNRGSRSLDPRPCFPH